MLELSGLVFFLGGGARRDFEFGLVDLEVYGVEIQGFGIETCRDVGSR